MNGDERLLIKEVACNRLDYTPLLGYALLRGALCAMCYFTSSRLNISDYQLFIDSRSDYATR